MEKDRTLQSRDGIKCPRDVAGRRDEEQDEMTAHLQNHKKNKE